MPTRDELIAERDRARDAVLEAADAWQERRDAYVRRLPIPDRLRKNYPYDDSGRLPRDESDVLDEAVQQWRRAERAVSRGAGA